MAFKDLGLSYTEALHGVQSAIAFEIEHELDIGLPTIRKHLRVGIDSAHAVNAALAELLIRKGLITRSDYEESIRLLMNNELALYEERINATYQTGSRLNFR